MDNSVVLPRPAAPALGCAQQPKVAKLLLKWKRPYMAGAYAVNCDGSFKERSGAYGYGIAIRDWYGGFMLAKAKHFHETGGPEIKYGIRVLMVEMLAIRDGLRLARGLELRRVEIQSDSKSAICIINGVSKCPKECLGLLSEIRAEASFFWGLGFVFVYREQNRAADYLSKFLTSDGEMCLDFTDTPQTLAQILREDALGVLTPSVRWN